MPRRRWRAVLVSAGLLGALADCGRSPRNTGQQSSATEKPAPRPGEVGARMPDFTFEDLSGKTVSTQEFRGKVLIIDFWATWCEPCKKEMPGFQDLQERYGDRGLMVIGLALDGDTDEAARFAAKLGVHYRLGQGTSEVQEKLGGLLGLPTTVLVDRQGIIRKKVIGFEYKDAFEAALKQVL